ncbi:killer cell lectin-like receptor subfamily B member 1B allele C [Elgaria multicarinata webbii]|uniref:killer cell lectin-like receptor subfamily B member 1B allele C n=1 Tax=Elgaria multicarinata webbii TaxID=159646 RepID=UPI002FCD3E63
MALNFQLRKEHRKQTLPSQVQEALPRQPTQHQLTVGAGCAMIFLLTGALIALCVWAFHMKRPMDVLEKDFISPGATKRRESNQCLETMSQLQRFLCKPLDNTTAESSSCRLCPQNWFLHKKKCYWISREKQTWHKSKEGCEAKRSQMVVIQNQEEVSFIQSITEGAQLLWIGLEASFPERKWTWVNGSPLDDNLFQELGPVEANFCGRLNGNQIIAEACSSVTTWM